MAHYMASEILSMTGHIGKEQMTPTEQFCIYHMYDVVHELERADTKIKMLLNRLQESANDALKKSESRSAYDIWWSDKDTGFEVAQLINNGKKASEEYNKLLPVFQAILAKYPNPSGE